jgi:hypothetical protein
VEPTPSSAGGFPTTTSSRFLSLESLFDTFDTPSVRPAVESSLLDLEEGEESTTTQLLSGAVLHQEEVRTLTHNFFRSGPALFPTGKDEVFSSRDSHTRLRHKHIKFSAEFYSLF